MRQKTQEAKEAAIERLPSTDSARCDLRGVAARSQVTVAWGQGNFPRPKGSQLSFQINPGKTYWGSLSSDTKVSKTLP